MVDVPSRRRRHVAAHENRIVRIRAVRPILEGDVEFTRLLDAALSQRGVQLRRREVFDRYVDSEALPSILHQNFGAVRRCGTGKAYKLQPQCPAVFRAHAVASATPSRRVEQPRGARRIVRVARDAGVVRPKKGGWSLSPGIATPCVIFATSAFRSSAYASARRTRTSARAGLDALKPRSAKRVKGVRSTRVPGIPRTLGAWFSAAR